MRSLLAPVLFLLFVPTAHLANAGSVQPGAPSQADVHVHTQRYGDVIRRFRADPSSSISDLSSWNPEHVRVAVQRLAGIIEALERLFTALAELEKQQHPGGKKRAYESQRAALIGQLQRAYDALYTGEVKEASESTDAADTRGALDLRRALSSSTWRRGLPESLVAFIRGAIGLHTAVAAEGWRHGASATVLNHIEFARAYFPRLLISFDPEYGRLWCRTTGTLLLAGDRHGAALKHIDGCLTWYRDDAWLLLARGSTLESAAILTKGLPAAASLADWPERLRAVLRQEAAASADYQAALRKAPYLSEARIRLARLQLYSGDLQNAALGLASVPQRELDPILAYWYSLLFGAIEERRNRPEEAAAHYREALTLYPGAQSAAVALSRVLAERLDAREEASALLQKQIRPSVPRPFGSDPWWLYRLGQAWHAKEWLDEIESRSRE